MHLACGSTCTAILQIMSERVSVSHEFNHARASRLLMYLIELGEASCARQNRFENTAAGDDLFFDFSLTLS